MRARRALIVLGLVGGLVTIGANASQGYVLFGRWSGSSTGLAFASSLPQSFRNAQSFGAAQWTNVSTSNWVFLKQSSSQNKLSYGPIDGSLGILAQTSVQFNGSGFISDADVTYDSAENWYTGSGNPGSNQIDLRSVAAHELGHVTGIDHTQTSNCPGATSDPTLCPFYTIGTSYYRTLETDDKNALSANYPGTPKGLAGKSVVHILYASLTDAQLAQLATVAFEGTVASVAPARWTGAGDTRQAFHTVTFRVDRTLRGALGRMATLTVFGASPAGSVDGSLASSADHDLRAGDRVVVLAAPGLLRVGDGTIHRTLRFAGAPAQSYARVGTAAFDRLRAIVR